MGILRRSFLLIIFTFHLSPFTLQAQYKVSHLEKPINTTGSETGAIRVGDTILAYSTMPAEKGGSKMFNFNSAQMQVWQARISRSGKLARPRPSRWSLNTKRDHTGNLALDPYTNDLYFTRCRVGDPDLRCEIWWAKKQRRGWTKAQPLRSSKKNENSTLNTEHHTATHPAVARLADSTVILYFVSDRPGGMGGMDIWYTLVKNGVAGECVNLGPQVNSPADEITPFYDQRNGVLYFSSNRVGGKGGYDIYCAVGQRNTWQRAEAVCQCLNSEQNDIYFTITQRDSATGIPVAGYLSSNRADSYFLNDSMCCNDIYRWELEGERLKVKGEMADTIIVAQQDTSYLSPFTSHLSPFIFPLFLYFHNDEPDPASRKGTTDVSYSDCQRRYAQLRGEYLSHQTSADDSAMMQQFFDSCVVGNYERVEQLFDYVEEQLDEGRSVVLTIAGYASPVFHSDYNQLLSERRIASFINMLRAWRGGLFADAMDNRRLTVEKKPMGVDNHSQLLTPNSSLNTIYSLPAATSRRIEILSCEVR